MLLSGARVLLPVHHPPTNLSLCCSHAMPAPIFEESKAYAAKGDGVFVSSPASLSLSLLAHQCASVMKSIPTILNSFQSPTPMELDDTRFPSMASEHHVSRSTSPSSHRHIS